MAIVSGDIVRVSAAARGLSIDVAAQTANFTPGTLYAVASDNAGLVRPAVTVTAGTGGAYTFSLDTIAALDKGHYQGSVTLKLCADAACLTPQAVASVTVPYDITVLSKDDAWAGDKLTPLTAWSDAGDWGMFQGNAAHTGAVPVALNPDKFSLRWRTGPIAAPDNYNAGYTATLVAANGLFYSAGNNMLQARREFDASVAWSYSVAGLEYPSVNPPAVADGAVYMMAGRQNATSMFGFDAATGVVRFRTPMVSQWDASLAPTAVAGALYTSGGSYGGMYGFGPAGDVMFSASISPSNSWTPALDATQGYAYTGDSLTVFNRKTGATLQKIVDYEDTNYFYQVGGAAVLGAPGTAYAAHYGNASVNSGTPGNSLMKFDTVKGLIDWRVKGSYPVTPAYLDGALYVPNGNPYRVEIRSETDGALRWSWTPQSAADTGWAAEPIVTKTHLFVSTGSTTYALDLRSHKPVWSYPAGGKLALSRNGVLYIQNKDALTAINLK